MKVRPLFAWYDLWAGVFIDLKNKKVYVMVFTVGIVIEYGKK